MQIRPEEILPTLEKAKALCFLDIESTNLKADYGTCLVASIKPYGSPVQTWTSRPGFDKGLLEEVSRELNNYVVWVTFYGRRFDVPFIQSRLVRHCLPPLPKRHHIDIWQVVKQGTCISRRNQAHLLEWFDLGERKMSLGPDVWAEVAENPKNVGVLKKRCESDVKGLEQLYDRTKHLIGEITR